MPQPSAYSNLIQTSLHWVRHPMVIFLGLTWTKSRYLINFWTSLDPFITLFKFITIFCGIDSIPQNIPHIWSFHITMLWIWIMLSTCSHSCIIRFNHVGQFHDKEVGVYVDRFLVWVPMKKTTQGRPDECQILYLGITIKWIDRSQGN